MTRSEVTGNEGTVQNPEDISQRKCMRPQRGLSTSAAPKLS